MPIASSSRATACASCERTSSHDHRHRRQPAPVGPQAPPTSLAPPAVWEGLPPGLAGPAHGLPGRAPHRLTKPAPAETLSTVGGQPRDLAAFVRSSARFRSERLPTFRRISRPASPDCALESVEAEDGPVPLHENHVLGSDHPMEAEEDAPLLEFARQIVFRDAIRYLVAAGADGAGWRCGSSCGRQKSSPMLSVIAHRGGTTMRARAVVLAVAIALAPLGARAADLVVWWEKGQQPRRTGGQGDRRGVRAEERQAGRAGPSARKRSLLTDLVAAFEAGRPPDFLHGGSDTTYYEQWAYEGRLVDLTDAVGPLFRPVRPGRARARPCSTGRRAGGASTCCRSGSRPTTSTSGGACSSAPASRSRTSRRSGSAFWSFWCDQVQPAVRKALGRDDVWGIGLPMSVDVGRHIERVLAVHLRLRGGLRDPRRPAGHRRPGGPAQAHQGDRQLHGHLPQGLHPARLRRRGTITATTRRSWRRPS